MSRIVGTAGHIDHGKTSLVRALTGQDTDRLPEEKARGISIELGFAYLQLSNGTRAGVVDVPGHERFIRTMLAGAHGIDLVLFTVAADDGVMPQTIEHLDIVRLLGVPQAIVVITKSDLVPAERIRQVESEITSLFAATPFSESPVIPVSTVTGAGLAELRGEIDRMLERPPHDAADNESGNDRRAREFFRLPVDRVFAIPGHGTVVTGTARGGALHTGDTVRVMPAGELVRVRHIQVHGESTSTATHGQRVALNLAGADLSSVQRGCTIADARLTTPSTQFNATLEVCASVQRHISNHQRVRVHVGTAERFGRLVLVGADSVAPRGSTYCRIVLAEPLLVMRGDRYVVRDETARWTLGGGAVLHPWPTGRVHRDRDGVARFRSLHTATAHSLVAVFVGEHRGTPVPLETIGQFLNLEPSSARAIAATAQLRPIGGEEPFLYTTERDYETLSRAVANVVGDYHARHRLELGRDIEETRVAVAAGIDPKVFRLLIDAMGHDGLVVRDGNRLHLPGHRVALGDSERQIASRVLAAIRNNPLSPPAMDELQQVTGVVRSALGDLLRVLEREQLIVKIGGAFYFLRETIDLARQEVAACADASGTITAARVRDRLGTTRKYTIPLLEYFDRTGLTIRIGDVHRLRTESRT